MNTRIFSALALSLTAAAQEQKPDTTGFVCTGEEPSWKIEVTESSATYSAPSAKGLAEQVFRGQLQQLTYLDPDWMVWRGATAKSPAEVLVLTIRQELCHSTMADGEPSPYRSILSLRAGEARTGCCRPRSVVDPKKLSESSSTANTNEDWARYLPDLLPVIQQCSTQAAKILKAWPMNRGKGAVRYQDSLGMQYDCVADLSGRATPDIKPVVDSEPPLPNAGNPVYWPAREQPPVIHCGRLEKVLNKNGVLVGYLQYDPCPLDSARHAKVAGSVTYIQRVALPPDAVIIVRLNDVSRMDAPAQTLAEQTIQAAGRQVPFSFELPYDPAKIDERHTYAVSARIEQGGKLLFISDTHTPVITRGNPATVEIRVVPARTDR